MTWMVLSAAYSYFFAGARLYTVKDVEAIFDVFQAHGHTEVRKPLEISQSQSSAVA